MLFRQLSWEPGKVSGALGRPSGSDASWCPPHRHPGEILLLLVSLDPSVGLSLELESHIFQRRDASGNNKSLKIYGSGNSFWSVNREVVRQRWDKAGEGLPRIFLAQILGMIGVGVCP